MQLLRILVSAKLWQFPTRGAEPFFLGQASYPQTVTVKGVCKHWTELLDWTGLDWTGLN